MRSKLYLVCIYFDPSPVIFFKVSKSSVICFIVLYNKINES